MTLQIAWESWIERHGAELLLYARRWARDQAEAEDWVQEGFARFWRNREKVKDPAFYLYRCVRTIAIDASRRRKSDVRREEALMLQSNLYSQFHSNLEDEEWKNQVEDAMRSLPIQQSEVVTLKIWSKLTFAQIAELTGEPIGTITSRYRYALKALKTLLSEHCIDD